MTRLRRAIGLCALLAGGHELVGCRSDDAASQGDSSSPGGPGRTADAGSAPGAYVPPGADATPGAAGDSGPPINPLACSSLACPGGSVLHLASRAFNLCLSAGLGGPTSYKCSGSDTSTKWRLVETGMAGRYALQNMRADACLVTSGATLAMSACNPTNAAGWWFFDAIDGDNQNHSTIRSGAGSCLSNESLDGYSGGLSLVACRASAWSQQWKKLGAQTEVSGALDAPWLGHTRACTDVGVVDGTCDANGKWWLATACEGPDFVPVRGLTPTTGFGCIRDNEICSLGTGCLLQRGFSPIAGTSSHVLTMALDKINWPVSAIDDTYTDAFLTDLLGSASGQPTRPRLSNEYVLDVRMKLHAAELKPDAPYQGHARALIGFSAVNLDTQRSMFVEVVLYRDAWYDLCTPDANRGGSGVTSPCDPSNLYDRRSAWATGEQVWYTASTMNSVTGAAASAQPTLAPDGQWYPYQVPVSRLFRAYAWGANVAPADWSRIELQGVYLGLEVFGRARVWLDIDGYRISQTSNWQQ